MGLQFENLVLKNCEQLFDCLEISTSDVIMFGPFFQRGTRRRKGCQIDLLIQTRRRTLYLCEIKFQANEIGVEVIEQIRKKQEKLSSPKGFSIHPVLICVNGVTEKVRASEYFDKIIDFSDFLRTGNE